jgi:DNA repair protein RadA/Sms
LKTKIKYVCTNCGYDSLRWLGKCPECGEWQSFTEEIVEKSRKQDAPVKKLSAYKINDIPPVSEERIKTNIGEFDRILGGGFITGSVVLLGGDPGIGKSTLAMQIGSCLNRTVLYVTGEESAQQIKMRSSRLSLKNSDLYILAETDLHSILKTIKEIDPVLVIFDSIQTMSRSDFDNSPGTITQIRECTSLILEEAKKSPFTALIIGHVTKEGIIAGPKILEHIVDTVINFEGDSGSNYRILRTQKNRFGSTNEIGIFEMLSTGLAEVKNPSSIFLGSRDNVSSGSAVTASLEGTRPILLEVQALVTPSHYGNPQRITTGFDSRRLSILLAVLEKRASLRLSASNVFLNLAGGLRIDEPAIDMAVCCSIASSLLDKVVNSKTVFIGEVGLGGEIRDVNNIEKRIYEAEKLGFEQAIIPLNNNKKIKTESLKTRGAGDIKEVLRLVFGRD